MWAGIAVLVAIVAVLALRPAGGGFRDVDAAGVASAVEKGAQLVDVRTEGEFQMGHIEGAVNIPLNRLEAAAQGWDRDRTYVIYCATGERSLTAMQIMETLGFTDVLHFAAGIQAWDGPLVQGAADPSSAIQTDGKPVMIEFYTDA